MSSSNYFQLKFISLSLILLLSFVFLAFIIAPMAFHSDRSQVAGNKADAFYFNQNYGKDDPLMTAVPDLGQIITGPIITGADPQTGSADAKINIAVYTDFTCYYCGQTMAAALKVQADFPGQVRVIHKDFPNADKTYKSYQAALAGRCAQAQGKFWEMSDFLYKNYNNLSQTLFDSLAKQLKLNLAQFQQCLQSQVSSALVDDNLKEANALRISGIPTVYVNEQELMGEVSYEELEKAVEKEK